VVGLRSFLWSQSLPRAAGVFVLLCSIALAVGLFGRRPWARWVALLAAVVLAPVAMLAFADGGSVLDLIWMLGNFLLILLLSLPATGRDPHRLQTTESSGLGVAGWLALGSLIGVVVVVIGVPSISASGPANAAAVMPASARAPQRVSWVSFNEGMQRAKLDGRPVLLTFYADWCGYCKKMDRTTWKASTVLREMQQVIAVRINAEQESPIDGVSGAQLAELFGVRGYPVQLLVDADGKTLARQDGYQNAGALVDWLRRNGAL
jgi:thiol:disulfide interchange protein